MDVSIRKLPYICYSFTRAYILQLKMIHQRGLVWLLPLASMDGSPGFKNFRFRVVSEY